MNLRKNQVNGDQTVDIFASFASVMTDLPRQLVTKNVNELVISAPGQ